MKSFVLLLLLTCSVPGTSQTPAVYFDFVTHNEETNQWNGTPYYTQNRTKIISLANYFQSKGITWNMQSDWVYLANVIQQETPALMLSTNNKNILRWMYEDKGVEMDPHAHESQYLYPDVVKLMDSIGLPESKVMGGTIYNDSNGINIWTNLVDGQYGRIFTNKFWDPDYMMGGGTPNHVADLKYYGIWNPKSPSEYLTHDTSVHLRHLGTGCTIKIKDTTQVANVVAQLKELVQNVQSGLYPPDKMYFQTIFFEQGDLNNNAFYNKVIEIADSASAIVSRGIAHWKTFKQAYTIWENNFLAQMYQWECGQVATAVQQKSNESFLVFPNPVMDYLHLGKISGEVNIFDITGRLLYHLPAKDNFGSLSINVSHWSNGIYWVRAGEKNATWIKQ